MATSIAVNCNNDGLAEEQDHEDFEMQRALDDFLEGLRTGCGPRAGCGLRRLALLEGSNIEFLLRMLRGDTGLFSIYRLKFEKNPVGDATTLIPESCSNLANYILAGELDGILLHLEHATTVDEADLELIATLLEGHEHTYPYLLRFVQRRSGPPVDELAAKAKLFLIHLVFKRVRKPGMRQKEAIWLVQKQFSGRDGFSKSTIYEALRYFSHRGKEDAATSAK